MPANLMEYFNKISGPGVLSTSGKDGRVDSALFASPHMTDEKTVIVSTAKNRTFANLLENPYAVFMILEQCPGSQTAAEMPEDPEKYIMGWKGIRVYMKMKEHETSGKMLETIRSQVAEIVGEEGAMSIYAVLTFEVYEVRPLVDIGQGWEKSV